MIHELLRARCGVSAHLSAVQWGNLSLVRSLLEYGADPFQARGSPDFCAPLHWAMRRGDSRIAWELLHCGGWPQLLLSTAGAPCSKASHNYNLDTQKHGVEAHAEHSTATSLWGGSHSHRLAVGSEQRLVVAHDRQQAQQQSSARMNGGNEEPTAPPNSPAAGTDDSDTTWPWGTDEPRSHSDKPCNVGGDLVHSAYGCTPLSAAIGASYTPLALQVRAWGHRALLLSAAQAANPPPNVGAGKTATGMRHCQDDSTYTEERASECNKLSHFEAMSLLGDLPRHVAYEVATMLL
jgi:hypothetical protein